MQQTVEMIVVRAAVGSLGACKFSRVRVDNGNLVPDEQC